MREGAGDGLTDTPRKVEARGRETNKKAKGIPHAEAAVCFTQRRASVFGWRASVLSITLF